MKDYLERPEIMARAKREHRGYPIHGEIAIFLLVFLVGSIFELIIVLPPQVVMMLTNETYMNAVRLGDMELINQATMEIVASDGAMVISLFAFAGIILAALLLGRWVDKRKLATYGFRKKGMFAEYGLGLVIGFVMFSAAVLICLATGSLKMALNVGSPLMLFLFFLGFMVQGMGEEVLCRGLLMVSLSRRYSIPAAILTNSLVFAALHLGNDGVSVLALINLTLFGIVASVYFIKRGSIWGVAAIHSVWNFVQGNFYGIRVSGMVLKNSVFNSELVSEGTLINGGDFGLEGGLAVTVTLLVCLVIFWKMPGKNTAAAEGAGEEGSGAEQGKMEQARAEKPETEQAQAEQAEAESNKIEQAETEQIKAARAGTEQNNYVE